MGADYYFYTEVRHNGRWVGIDPLVKRMKNNVGQKEDGYVGTTTYWNGSRTYFGDTYDKLVNISTRRGEYDKLSDEVKEFLKSAYEEGYFDDESIKEINESSYVIPYKNIADAMPKRDYDCAGYVPVEILAKLDDGAEIDEYIGVDEYKDLPEDEKKAYEFYRWRDPYGWPVHLMEIKDRVDRRVKDFMDVNYMWDWPEEVRVIMFVSY